MQPTASGAQRREMENLTSRQLGDFRLLRRLGRGGMADVYLAEQSSLNRRVAIKVLRPDLQTDEVHLKRFQREAIAAGGLNHPNIVQVYVIGEADGYHFIAEEYVQGLNLREYLNRKGPPDLPVALHIMRQVASALAAAAEAGIVHRDIKPENILLNRRGDVKVADFGLAQLTHADERVDLTQDGVTMGTPLYMSPEQIRGRTLDSRSDIYSFGATFYHMLAGRPPFFGQTGMMVAARHLSEQPEPLGRRRPDLPPELCDFVHRSMEKNPDDRFAGARELLADLRRLAKSHKVDSSGATGVTAKLERPLQEARPTPLQRFATALLTQTPAQRALAIIASCLIVGGIAAAVGWWVRPGSPLAETQPAHVRPAD
jgi:serine/threonine-protein kinase